VSSPSAGAPALLDGLPRRARAQVERLLEEAVSPVGALRRDIDGFSAYLRGRIPREERARIEAVQRLAERCHELLDTVQDHASEDRLRIVQAGVRYLFESLDAQPASAGADDEERVLAWIGSELDRVASLTKMSAKPPPS
jgi:hypothetical protein